MWEVEAEDRRRRERRIEYVVEVAARGARAEHRFEGYENAKRYAADVQRLNPDVEVRLYQWSEGWISEVRSDAWRREGER